MMRDDDEVPADLRDLFAAERGRDDDGPPAGAKERVASALSITLGIGIGAAATAATSAAGATLAGAGAGSGAATAAGASGAATTAAAATTTAAAAATTTAASVAAGTGATTAAGAGFTATGGALAKGLAFVFATAVAGTTGTGIYLAAKDESTKPAIVEVGPSSADVPSTFDPKMLGKKPAPPVVEKPIVKSAPVAVTPVAPVVSAPVVSAPVVEVERVPLAPLENTPEAKAERLRGERAILDTARSAVARGDGGAALIALEAHRSTYADGALVEERDALTVLALAKLGRSEEAKKKADAFRERNPHSLFLKAIDGALR